MGVHIFLKDIGLKETDGAHTKDIYIYIYIYI